MKILLVDDDADDHEFFKQAIDELCGKACEVISLFNGQQLLEFLKKNIAVAPDFLVLDLNMPVMDGVTALAGLRKLKGLEHLTIFVLSTSNNDESASTCRSLGCKEYYTKGNSYNKLKETVRDMLVKARA